MNHIYVRAPGPGAIIRLLDRFSNSEPWTISVTPADVLTGYRCVMVTGVDLAGFANYLSMCLRDNVLLVETSPERLLVTQCSHSDTQHISGQTLFIELQISKLPILRDYQVKRALKSARLPGWVIKLKHLKAVSYETIAVLDQRDLLVEAQDVLYTSQGNIPD